MFDGDYVTKPSSFILPFVLLLAGGAIGTYWIWWLGITVCILAGLITLWLVLHSTLDRVIAMIEASTEYYKAVHGMTDEEKIATGLKTVADDVRVEKTDGKTHWKYDFLPISPVKMKTIAEETLKGRSFSEREWMGKNNPLSDSECRRPPR